MDNEAVLARDNIKDILELYDCGLRSSYDMSQVFVCDKENDNKAEIKNKLIEIDFSKRDEDLMAENKKNILKAKMLIKKILSKNNLKIETNYCVSFAYIFDAYGNKEKISY